MFWRKFTCGNIFGNLMMHTWGVCECCGFYFKEQQVTVGSGKWGEFPSSPVYAKEGSWTTAF